MGGQKILIVFPDPWIKFAPSVLNFAEMLRGNGFIPIVLLYSNGDFSITELPFSYKVVTLSSFLDRLLLRLRILKVVKFVLLFFSAMKLKRVHNFIGATGYDDIGYVCTRLLGLKSIYFSLEVNHSLFNWMIFSFLNPWLIIQNRDRKAYLASRLPNERVMYIHNSPIVSKEIFTNIGIKNTHDRRGLVYFGLLSKEHGVECCIDIAKRSKEVLTIKYFASKSVTGYLDYLKERYRDLIDEGQVIFDNSYIAQNDVIDYLSHFKIGLALYLPSVINSSFNYASSPSGKVFNYIIAGLPVVVNDSIGFRFVSELNVGIQITNTGDNEIIRAIETIKENYDFYVRNALESGEKLAYNTMFNENKERIFKVFT